MSLMSSPRINVTLTTNTSVEVLRGEDYHEHQLTVSFSYEEWSEGHDWGDTTAYQRVSEIEDVELELDGASITQEQLNALLGEEEAKKVVEGATEDAINSL